MADEFFWAAGISASGRRTGGQRQALTMLIAALIAPRVLLLDERTAGLQPKTVCLILDLTREILAYQHLTTLTHNLSQVLKMGDRLIMLHHGKVFPNVQDEEKRAGRREGAAPQSHDKGRPQADVAQPLSGPTYL